MLSCLQLSTRLANLCVWLSGMQAHRSYLLLEFFDNGKVISVLVSWLQEFMRHHGFYSKLWETQKINCESSQSCSSAPLKSRSLCSSLQSSADTGRKSQRLLRTAVWVGGATSRRKLAETRKIRRGEEWARGNMPPALARTLGSR